MVTILKSVPAAGGAYVEGFALSSDTLPIAGITNGSKMEVLDASTGVLSEYRYNQAGGAWVAITEPAADDTPGGEEAITVGQDPEVVTDTPGGTG